MATVLSYAGYKTAASGNQRRVPHERYQADASTLIQIQQACCIEVDELADVGLREL